MDRRHTQARASLRAELAAHGYSVAQDTDDSRGELYILGDGDRAAALFEFKETADEACMTMYQGSWAESLPPRFAVLPASQRDEPAVDMLAQAGLSALFYKVSDSEVAYLDLETAFRLIAERNKPDA